jgi:hypothetical protein
VAVAYFFIIPLHGRASDALEILEQINETIEADNYTSK